MRYYRAMPTAVPAISLSAPVLVAGRNAAVIVDGAGSAQEVTHAEAIRAVAAGMAPIVCHRPQVARRLGTGPFAARDALELFAFVRPARFCPPTVNGVADAVGVPRARARGLEAEARTLRHIVELLLTELDPFERDVAAIAGRMAEAGWTWGPDVMAVLRAVPPNADAAGFAVWRRLPEWAEQAPEPPPGNKPVEPEAARNRLAALVGRNAEERPQQGDYASAVTAAFAPREEEGAPNVVIAEAGTGVGKTLGYLAPASLWAERNKGPVWVSTFTRNLQRQIDGELDRLYRDPAQKARRVVIRKGRENYLCLLNYEDAAARLPLRAEDTVALGLMARWAAASRDGDMMGGDFPAWLADLVGHRNTLGLADRRGECIYSACDHYRRCFVERAARRARRADIVIANHALVMTQAASGGLDDGNVPTRLVFDEGHHVFDAADSAFSANLSGHEAADLRRWLLGPEQERRSRARGLARRIGDVAGSDERAAKLLEEGLRAARALPGPGWQQRLATEQPIGPAEAFLALVRRQVYARAEDPRSPYDLETETKPSAAGLLDASAALEVALGRLAEPLRALGARLATILDEQASEFDPPTRGRVDAVCRGLRRRVEGEIESWRAMLRGLAEDTPKEFVDWFAVTRADGRDLDVGMHRHWLDPTVPLARAVFAPAHGVVLTSATLRDGTGDAEADWTTAEARTGASHLSRRAMRALMPSPFDYAALTRVLVVTDVDKSDVAQVASAYRELFLAAGGGGLGLFTAIHRLRAVHARIAGALEEAGIMLLAQHVDHLDATSLVEIFRAEEDSCLLGTDAMRDGVDVPGRSLRLIVFDRVPWARPSILYRERRRHFAATRYDDMVARLRLKQAYGRLVRRADDRGVFVVLDSRLPSRLAGAFPEGVEIRRIGLAEAIDTTRAFLAADAHQ
jgi:ATP-dependent DNA helicase DinG